MSDTEKKAEVLELPVVEASAEIIPKTHAEIIHDELKGIEDEVFETALQNVRDVMAWSEIDPTMKKPPEEWVQELGEKRAKRKFTVAKAAWMSAKEAPVGIKIDAQVFTQISRARAMEKQAPRNLNINVVQMSAPLPDFPVLKLKKGA